MLTSVIAGYIVYSLTYLITAFLFKHYLSAEISPSSWKDWWVVNRQFYVNAINFGVALIALVITYFSGAG